MSYWLIVKNNHYNMGGKQYIHVYKNITHIAELFTVQCQSYLLTCYYLCGGFYYLKVILTTKYRTYIYHAFVKYVCVGFLLKAFSVELKPHKYLGI